MQRSPHGSRAARLRRRLDVVAPGPGLVLVGVLVLLAVPGLVVLGVETAAGGPLVGLALLVPGAIAVGAERLGRATPGPAIHDRELDRIVAGLTTAAAVAIGVSALLGARADRPVLVVPVGLLAVAAVALLHGTRRLWHLRAVPLLLLAAWPTPWEAPAWALSRAVGADTAAFYVTGLVLLVVTALLVGPRLRHRSARRHSPVLPAPAAVPAIETLAPRTEPVPAPVALPAAGVRVPR